MQTFAYADEIRQANEEKMLQNSIAFHNYFNVQEMVDATNTDVNCSEKGI